MKKIVILFSFFLSACVVEPEPILFDFKFVNNLKYKLVIKRHLKKYNSPADIDTLYPSKFIVEYQSSFDCYNQNLKDTLINSFFDTLQITTVDGKINLNPFDRKNWQEVLDLKEGLTSKKGCLKGQATYILEIDSSKVN